MKRRIDVRSRAEVVEPARVAVGEQKIESIGVAMSATGMAVVERDVRSPFVATEDGDSLCVEQRRTRRERLERRKRLARAKQRAPAQIGTRERRRRPISLDVRRGDPATGVGSRNVIAVHALQRADQRRIVGAREPQLAVFGDAPLPKRNGVLGITPRREA